MAFLDRFTYEVAPVFTLMEDVVLRRMLGKIGWENEGEGIFAPGLYFVVLPIPLNLCQHARCVCLCTKTNVGGARTVSAVFS